MTTPVTNVTEFTVSELSFALKRTVEDSFALVRVRGEISGFKGAAGSGHCYFRLKDDRACLEAVVWKTTLGRLRFKPQEGLEMVATGKLTTYPGRSNYQIVVDNLEPAGAGALMALLDERRRKLQAEGLFETARKRPIPYLPATIGVVTSPTGAVIRDILHRLRDRYPRHVLLWPVRVQGEGAAEEVAAAVAGFNALPPGGPMPRPDLLIVARGGGSIEDLWAFNEEVAVRAVAASGIPVIAAVGHETDWTLVDHAADLRAPTPTGAAEMAVPVRAELLAAVGVLDARHRAAARRHFDAERRHCLALCRALPTGASLLAIPRQRLDELGGRLRRASPGAGRLRTDAEELGRRLRRCLPAELEAKRRGFVGVTLRLTRGLAAEVTAKRGGFDGSAGRLNSAAVLRALNMHRSELDSAVARSAPAIRNSTRASRSELGRISGRIEPAQLRRRSAARASVAVLSARFAALQDTASPAAIMARGYAIVRDEAGCVILSGEGLRLGQRLDIRFAQGQTTVAVAKTASTPVARGHAATALPSSSPQKSLF